MKTPNKVNMLNSWLRQRMPQLARTWVRQQVSPRLTNIYSKLGLVDRAKLTENLKSLDNLDQAQLIDQLARNGILKWRYYKQLAPAKGTVKDLAHFMLSGRVDKTMLEAVSKDLTAGVFSSKSALLPRLVNRATSLAFYAAIPTAITGYLLTAGASFNSIFWGAAGFAIASKVLHQQAKPGTVLEKLDRFNPVSGLGRLMKLGNRLFWPSVLVGGSLFALAAYDYVSTKFYPQYENDRQITITSDNGRVMAEVCNAAGQACLTSELFAFEGSNAARQSRQSAQAIQEAVNNQDLFLGGLSTVGHEIRVGDAWRPGWLPSWLPLGSSTLIDASSENLTNNQRAARFSIFFGNLRSSGILPTADRLAQADIQRLEAQLPYNIFRDPSLSHRLNLATRYLQLDNYARAEALAQEIMNYNLTVTASRDMFTDEAVFLLADSNRMQAMRFFDPAGINESMSLLREHVANLQSLEHGYRARYNFEMLKTCTLAEQFFPSVDTTVSWELEGLCTPTHAATYRNNATFVNNQLSPTFTDNFLAVRTFLLSGKYNLTVARSGTDIERAREEYHNALALIELIDNCSAPTSGNISHNWTRYSPYMRPFDRTLGDTLGYEAGLASFAARCEAGRTLRGDLRSDLPLIGRSEQFNPILFRVFRAQAHQGLAETEMRLADRNSQHREEHWLAAKDHLTTAYTSVLLIRNVDIAKFYSKMYEERETYYSVLIDYSAVLLRLYVHNPQKYSGNLELAQQLASEAVSQRGEEELDILYLRGLMTLADIDMIRNDRSSAATRIQTILDRISQAEALLPEGRVLSPHYQFLKDMAQDNLSLVTP